MHRGCCVARASLADAEDAAMNQRQDRRRDRIELAAMLLVAIVGGAALIMYGGTLSRFIAASLSAGAAW